MKVLEGGRGGRAAIVVTKTRWDIHQAKYLSYLSMDSSTIRPPFTRPVITIRTVRENLPALAAWTARQILPRGRSVNSTA